MRGVDAVRVGAAVQTGLDVEHVHVAAVEVVRDGAEHAESAVQAQG